MTLSVLVRTKYKVSLTVVLLTAAVCAGRSATSCGSRASLGFTAASRRGRAGVRTDD